MANLFKIAGVLLVMLTSGFLIALVKAKGLFSSETAAWIQAIGSIVAIAATGWAASLPIRAAERQRIDGHRSRLMFIERAASLAIGDLDVLRGHIAAGDVAKFKAHASFKDTIGMDTLRHVLAEPISTWPTVDLHLAARDLLVELDEWLKAAKGMAHWIIYEVSFKDLEPNDTGVREAAEVFRDALKAARR